MSAIDWSGLVTAEARAAEALRAARVEALSAVAVTMAELRRRHVTDLPAQALIYSAKRQEAEAFLAADPEPADLAAFPFLATEVAAGGAETAWQAAHIIAWRAAELAQVAVALETIRLTAVYEVEAAASAEAVGTAMLRFRTSVAALGPPQA
jgi:hypothetical protein